MRVYKVRPSTVDHDASGPSLLESTGRRTSCGTGCEDIINEQDRSAFQTGIASCLECAAHCLHTLCSILVCQMIGGLDPPERLVNTKIDSSRQSMSQGLCLIVTAAKSPPPVERNWNDPSIPRQSEELGLPSLCEEVTEPAGQPGVALVLQ